MLHPSKYHGAFLVCMNHYACFASQAPSITVSSRQDILLNWKFIKRFTTMSQTGSEGVEATMYPDPEPKQQRPNRSTYRQKKRDTHFLCLPLVTESSVPQLAKSLSEFRDLTVLPVNEDFGSRSTHDGPNQGLRIIPMEAHRPPGTFHLTLGVMDLSKQEDRDRALSLLQQIDYQSILDGLSLQHEASSATRFESASKQGELPDSQPNNQDTDVQIQSLTRPISPPHLPSSKHTGQDTSLPIKISLQGLSTFPKPSEARVFYARPIDPTSRLHPFALAVRQRFREAGLITEARALVLHATVANLRYAVQKSKSGGRGRGKSYRQGNWNDDGQVDARTLIEIMDKQRGESERSSEGEGEFLWADEISVDTVAICKLGAEKSEDEVLGMVYPPIGEKRIIDRS